MSSNLVRESWKVLGPKVRLPFANLSGTGAFSSMGMKPRETKTQLPSEVGVINLETVCFLSTWSKRVQHNQTSTSLDQSDANSNLSFLTDTAKCADLVSKIIYRWWYRTQDLPITSQPCQPQRTFNSCLFFPCRLHFEESPTSFQRERREDESPPLFRRQRVQLHRRRRRESRQAGQGSPDLLGAGVLIGRRVLKLPSEAFRSFRTSHQIDYQERFLSPIFFCFETCV